MKTTNFLSAGFYFGLLAICTSCATVFSDLQSARMTGEGQVELSPSYGHVTSSSENETESVQNQIGIQASYGVNKFLDLRFRTEYLFGTEGFDGGIWVMGFGPKISLIKNYLAFYVPVGTNLNGEINEWQLHPTLLYTAPFVRDKFEFTISSKYIHRFCEECKYLMALNFGFDIGKDLSNWKIRPEFGILFRPGDEGNMKHFSIGFSKTLAKK